MTHSRSNGTEARWQPLLSLLPPRPSAWPFPDPLDYELLVSGYLEHGWVESVGYWAPPALQRPPERPLIPSPRCGFVPLPPPSSPTSDPDDRVSRTMSKNLREYCRWVPTPPPPIAQSISGEGRLPHPPSLQLPRPHALSGWPDNWGPLGGERSSLTCAPR